jgi:hypothetical protein
MQLFLLFFRWSCNSGILRIGLKIKVAAFGRQLVTLISKK